MITAGNRDGYANATVSAIIAEAGVSRPTFYEYFADKEACFLSTISEVQQQLLGVIAAAITEQPAQLAHHAALQALLQFAAAEPAMARFLTNEPMAGGPNALDARDLGITHIEQLIEARLATVEANSPLPDLSVPVMIGGLYRLLASRLRRGEPRLPGMLEDLQTWITSYEMPASERRWRTLQPLSPPPHSPFVPDTPLQEPAALAPGRRRRSEEEVAENHRQRLMFAAARLAASRGYSATTIADIAKLARVDGRVFYAMFTDKQDAFMAVHEHGYQQVMAVTAAAFFAGKSWPERNWEAGRAFTQYLERNPLVAHVGFVEAYAVGPGAVQRVEDSHLAFAMLLQEGYQHGNKAPPRLVLEAIITAIFEIVYRQTRAADASLDGAPALAGLLAHLTFLVLAPFCGAEEANAYIAGKVAG